MVSADAYQVVEDMLLVCQKIVSIADENGTERPKWLDAKYDVRPLLIDIITGVKPLDGLGLYNLMSIAHRHCPEIAAMAPLRLPAGRDLPHPDVSWSIGFEDA